ncbi:MAG: SCP2 sterol-binding domain-containing protein [Ardenticatenaceae bacterium]|nr:SCP2 sterol-binding domain-containing protein [Ardenticatenaceae bacterium]
MSFLFPSDQWVKELMSRLNDSEAYSKAAAKWEGDFAFVIDHENGSMTHLYMDLWHGDCRSARELENESDESPAFTMTAPIATWQLVLTGKLDPIKGLMQKKLALKGNMMKVLKAPKAAVEMVNCAKEIDTSWPG